MGPLGNGIATCSAPTAGVADTARKDSSSCAVTLPAEGHRYGRFCRRTMAGVRDPNKVRAKAGNRRRVKCLRLWE